MIQIQFSEVRQYDPDVTRAKIHEIVSNNEGAWFRALKHDAPSSQGETGEWRLFGNLPNNSKKADFEGVEIKTSSALMTTFRPVTSVWGCEYMLRDVFGKMDAKNEKLCFGGTWRMIPTVVEFTKAGKVKKKHQKRSLTARDGSGQVVSEITRANGSINLVLAGVVVGGVAESVVEQAMNKTQDLAILRANKRLYPALVDGVTTLVDHYNYPDYVFYCGFSMDAFWHEFDLGNITIEFRVRGVKDHGTCIKISRKVLERLYARTITRSEYEAQMSETRLAA